MKISIDDAGYYYGVNKRTPSEERLGSVEALAANSPLAYEIEFLTVKAFSHGTRLANARLESVGLRARSYSVLALACSGIDLTQRDLSSLLELDPSQIVALVDRLEADGLVTREVAPGDRRMRVVRATAAGRDAFEKAQAITSQAEADALAMLTGPERETLRALLRKINFAEGPAEQLPSGDGPLLYLIKQVELGVRASLEDAVAAVGLTALQYTALTVLARHPRITSAQLARDSFVRPQTMAQMVSTLERAGYLERERDPKSQRQLLISLTPQGREIIDRLRRPVADVEATMVAELDDAQVAGLRQALHACRTALGALSR